MTAKQSVVVGVDGSACSKAAIDWAVEYAGETGRPLVLVTAWQWPMSYGIPISYDGYNPEEDALKLVEATAADVQLPEGMVTLEVSQGSPGDVLVAASAAAGLLVVGSRGHGSLAGALLGSTSNYCVHHAHCPVLVVR